MKFKSKIKFKFKIFKLKLTLKLKLFNTFAKIFKSTWQDVEKN